MVIPFELHAELIHATKYILEAFAAACFLTLIYFISPYIRGAK